MTHKKTIDLRKTDKSDLLTLSRLLMNLQTSLSLLGLKVTVKKTSKPKNVTDEQKFTKIS